MHNVAKLQELAHPQACACKLGKQAEPLLPFSSVGRPT